MKKYIHTSSIAVRQNKKEAFSGSWLNCTVDVAILTNMVAWNGWPKFSEAPTVFRLVDASEASLILKH